MSPESPWLGAPFWCCCSESSGSSSVHPCAECPETLAYTCSLTLSGFFDQTGMGGTYSYLYDASVINGTYSLPYASPVTSAFCAYRDRFALLDDWQQASAFAGCPLCYYSDLSMWVNVQPDASGTTIQLYLNAFCPSPCADFIATYIAYWNKTFTASGTPTCVGTFDMGTALGVYSDPSFQYGHPWTDLDAISASVTISAA